MAVYHDGNFVVTAPERMSLQRIEGFIAKKSKWVLNKLDYFRSFEKFRDSLGLPANKKERLAMYKEQALALAHSRLEHFNQYYSFRYAKISIKDQKTMWGSCSRKGNLSFSYKLALLPPEHADYIIVHELCHMGEFNHSKRFWQLVSRTIPDYLRLRRALNKSNYKLL